VWLGVLAVLCLASTAFALLTFLLDTDRFLYPEKYAFPILSSPYYLYSRCVIFLNLSYLLLSLGYLVRLAAGPEGVACSGPLPGSPGQPLRLLVREGIAPTPTCTLVFLLLYFASLSAAMWWGLTTLSWAVLVLGGLQPRALEPRSPLLHCLGWGLPAAVATAALVMHQVTTLPPSYYHLPGGG
jgi:hypothetical protein